MDRLIHRNKWALGRTHSIILEDGRGIARVSVYDDEPDVAWILNVSVIPESRERGLGNRILREAEEEARLMGAKCVKLTVESVGWCEDWYKRHGYEVVDVCIEINGDVLLKKLN